MIHEVDDNVQIRLGTSTVSVPAKTILGDLLARLQPPINTARVATDTPPRIGEVWPGQGGVYAGIVRGADGAPDYHLVVLNIIEMKDQTWQQAITAATEYEHEGHRDYALPNRRDQSVLFANAGHLFEAAWYWSCEQYAGSPGYAWSQGFSNGHQLNYHKGYTARARAVRRLPI